MARRAAGDGMMTFGGHLEALRHTLFCILGVGSIASIVVFCMKDATWAMLLAPSKYDFATYRWAESLMHAIGWGDFSLGEFHVKLISTGLSSQFMAHLTTSVYLGLLITSPYILYELFRFVSPALFESERRHSVRALVAVYLLFIAGVLICYFVIFPISFRFLGTYSVSGDVEANITLDSYVSTFLTLSLLMGVVFQLPVAAFVLGRLGLIDARMLSRYKKHAFIAVLTVAAMITPGQDIFSLAIVTLPLYMLYMASILVVRKK